MKNFLVPLVILAGGFAIWFPFSSWYPFGYPVQTGDVWEITWIYNEGSPIEERSVTIVQIDSTFKGYIIKATNVQDGRIYTNGSEMRRFIGSWGHIGPDNAKLLQRN